MLFVFDLDGTLIRSFLEERVCDKCEGTGELWVLPHGLEDCGGCRGTGRKLCHAEITYDEVEWLPRRRSVLAAIAQQGHQIALATNQTGVEYGYQTHDQLTRKLQTVSEQSGVHMHIYVCTSTQDVERRKPNPGMIIDARRDLGATRWETVFVGDLPTDEQAARNAQVAFAWANDFFA